MNEMLLLAELLKKHRLETQEKDKRIAELEEELFKQSQESKEEVLRAIEIILEKDARIAELEKELESSLYFNVDVVRCLSKIAWEHNHEDIPHYMNLAKQCIKSIESKKFKALKERVK